MVKEEPTIFSVGHSSRSIDGFLALLTESNIECVVDVRRLPGSRAFPHFNADALAEVLAKHDIAYWHLDALCGRRSIRELAGAQPEIFWTNKSFARYAAYARSQAFTLGLRELIERAQHQRCALMCSEAVWWRCHRRIIADHLIARGRHVNHIMAPRKVDAATLTRGAMILDGAVIYPELNAAYPTARNLATTEE